MSRVRENQQKDAERLAEQKRLEKDNQKQAREKSDQFSKTLTNKKEGQAKAGQKQVTQKHGNPGQKAAKKAAGQNALLARQGIASNQFAAKLAQTGFQAVTNTKSEGTHRNDDIRETKEGEDKQSKVERKEEGNRQDRVEGIGRDDGQGGGGSMGGGNSDSSQHQENPMAATAAIADADGPAAAAVTGPNAPKLPDALIQEIVKRVLVGTTEEGLSEFHIEFKSDVLGGVRLEISSEGGKIKAKFVTDDVNVGRLLKASEGQLSRAFGHKGLQLDRLEVEVP